MKKDKNIKKDETLKEEDIERMELLRKASEKLGKQLSINVTTGRLSEIDELKELVGKQFDNPEEKYEIYYNLLFIHSFSNNSFCAKIYKIRKRTHSIWRFKIDDESHSNHG